MADIKMRKIASLSLPSFCFQNTQTLGCLLTTLHFFRLHEIGFIEDREDKYTLQIFLSNLQTNCRSCPDIPVSVAAVSGQGKFRLLDDCSPSVHVFSVQPESILTITITLHFVK